MPPRRLLVPLGIVLAAVLVWVVQRERASAAAADRADGGGAEGAVVAPVDASGHRSAPPTLPGEPGVLGGLVRDALGRPVEGATCLVEPGRSVLGFASPPREPRTLETGADGAFAFAVDEGWWSLEVGVPGLGRLRLDHLRPGDHRVVELEPAVGLRVGVRDPAGRPLEDVRCTIVDDFHRLGGRPLAGARTDAEGLALLAEVAPGQRYLRLDAPGRRLQVEILDVPRGTSFHEVAVGLAEGHALAGRVLAAEDGAPLAGARVRVEAYASGPSLIVELVTGRDGGFATEPLFAADEPVTVRAAAPGRGEHTEHLLVRPSEASGGSGGSGGSSGSRERSIELRLERGGRTLEGRAVDRSGRPLPGVSVSFLPALPLGRGRAALAASLQQVTPHRERWRAAETTAADGSFALEGLARDLEYVVLLHAEGLAPAVRWVEAAEEEHSALGDLALAPAAVVEGFVLAEEDDAPLAGVRVRAQLEILLSEDDFGSALDPSGAVWRPSAWWRALETVTAEDGSFRLRELAPGAYDLFAGERNAGLVQLAAGARSGPHLLRVPRADFAREEEDRLHGVVQGPDGEPVGEAFVALVDAGASAGASGSSDAASGTASGTASDTASDAAPVAMTMTDFRGRFTLSAPRGRELALHVTALVGGFLDHDAPLGAEARAGAPLEVRLARRAEPCEPLYGLVVDPSGAPLGGISVALEPPENRHCGCLSFTTTSGPDGLVVFRDLADKDYRVVARDPRKRWEEVAVFPARAGGYFEVMFR